MQLKLNKVQLLKWIIFKLYPLPHFSWCHSAHSVPCRGVIFNVLFLAPYMQPVSKPLILIIRNMNLAFSHQFHYLCLTILNRSWCWSLDCAYIPSHCAILSFAERILLNTDSWGHFFAQMEHGPRHPTPVRYKLEFFTFPTRVSMLCRILGSPEASPDSRFTQNMPDVYTAGVASEALCFVLWISNTWVWSKHGIQLSWFWVSFPTRMWVPGRLVFYSFGHIL